MLFDGVVSLNDIIAPANLAFEGLGEVPAIY